MRRRIMGWATPWVMGMLAGACGDGTGPDEVSVARVERVAARLGIAAVAVAAGGQGRGFFDNFIPCPRRGVIDHSNTASGRRVRFSGCDLGDGIVVTGAGELRWAGPDLADTRGLFCDFATPAAFCESTLRWEGSLTITVDDQPLTIGAFAVDDLEMTDAGVRFPDDLRVETADLGFVSMRVRVGETALPVSDAALVAAVFDPVLTPDGLANPANELSVLTDADLQRIVFQGVLELASLLVNETLETQRGDHTHDLDCGTIEVTVVGQLPIVTNTWSACEAGGTFFTGQFTLTWGVFDAGGGPITMVIDGPLTLSGGLPTIALERVSWTVAAAGTDGIRVSGSLDTATGTRAYDFTVTVDD